jgi:hypothetical protein
MTDTDINDLMDMQRQYLTYQHKSFQAALNATITTIDGGYRIKETDTHYIDVMQMLFNWRITTTPKDMPYVYDRGWCYQGTNLAGFLPAALAAIAWDGSDDTEPAGYFKRVGSY